MASVSKKFKVSGGRYTGQVHPGTDSPVVEWFATNLEMPSKRAAIKWMNDKRKAYQARGIMTTFSYHESISKSYDIVEDEKGKIKLWCFGRG